MKFGVHLSTNVTPEWNSQYIQYQSMKEWLDKAVASAPVSIIDKEDAERYFLRVDEEFFKVGTAARRNLLSTDQIHRLIL